MPTGKAQMVNKSTDPENAPVSDVSSNKTMANGVIVSPGSEFPTDNAPQHRPSIDMN